MRFRLSACAVALTTLLAGCNVSGCNINVEQTDTGFVIEITCPTLDDAGETGDGEDTADETPDVDPGTDEVIDGETPAATDL